MWSADIYIPRAEHFGSSHGSKNRLFFSHFFIKSIMGISVVGIWSGKFFPEIICIMAFIKKNIARAPPLGNARAHLKKWNFHFSNFRFFQISNYHIWPANLWILMRPEYVVTICMSYRPHKPNRPNRPGCREIHKEKRENL